jgi:DNA-directed RNA polymerase subunit L
MDKIDIKITQIHKQKPVDLTTSQLALEISGSSVNAELVNTLRRLALDYVPTYAFAKETINIEKDGNTSIFNNDYMRLRLMQLTVPNIKTNISYLPEKYWRDVKYDDPEREKFKDDKKKLEIYMNVTNTTNSNMNVTTDSLKYYEDNEEKPEKFKTSFPSLIIQLRPQETFKFRAECVLGVGKRSNIWSAVGTSYYEEITPEKFNLFLESQGQLDEYDILHKSCDIMRAKLNEFKDLLIEKSIKNQDELLIRLPNEDHTLGNIINAYLQLHKNIAFSAVRKMDLLQDEVELKIKSVDNNPLKYVLETVEYIIKLFNAIEKLLFKH